MEPQPRGGTEDRHDGETPEDVAILYSWANLEGAKYRDFSANRREYRAQMRHRAAEQLRLMQLRAQFDAESAAAQAEFEAAAAHAEADAATARLAESRATSVVRQTDLKEEEVEIQRRSSLREAAQQARRASAERLEAARRAEAAALAASIARREEREIVEAQASGLRQAAQYAEADVRSRQNRASQAGTPVPGRISDPYGPQALAEGEYFELPGTPFADLAASRFRQQREYIEQSTGAELPAFRVPTGATEDRARTSASSPTLPAPSHLVRDHPSARFPVTHPPVTHPPVTHPKENRTPPTKLLSEQDLRFEPRPRAMDGSLLNHAPEEVPAKLAPHQEYARPAETGPLGRAVVPSTPYNEFRRATSASSSSVVPPVAEVVSRIPELPQLAPFQAQPQTQNLPQEQSYLPTDSFGPAWLSPQQESSARSDASPEGPAARSRTWVSDLPSGQFRAASPDPSRPQSATPTSETLQHSREQVASRWYALKGLFTLSGDRNGSDSGARTSLPSGRDPAATRPIAAHPPLRGDGQTPREQPRNAPIVIVFSLAGGVGKTSLVATLGRGLSSLGERVLLTDTTSHGLLPYYFGASELRYGVVRTFSPPVGSVDSPIHLVGYDLDANPYANPRPDHPVRDPREAMIEDLLGNSQRVHRVLIDLDADNAWLADRLARFKPIVLVPLAANMNSVISLRAIERRFSGMQDGSGNRVLPFYLLNQFDASIPLHLDLREVFSQQLGDRLLPFVVRRADGISEALADGMTIVDYDPDASVVRDYLSVANWLRETSAPAAMGLRTQRWSERSSERGSDR